MQILWVSGAVGQIKTLNLTFKTLVIGLLSLTIVLIFLGSALQFFGFRMAIEYDPALARTWGDLHTAVELENLHALYQHKLNDVNAQLEINRSRIKELEVLNQKLAVSATPVFIRKDNAISSGMGGNFEPLTPIKSKSPLKLFAHTYRDIELLNQQLDQTLSNTRRYLDWLKSKPIHVPVHGSPSLASGFGARTDPFTFTPSFHPGLDFNSAIGTPFFATANGRVIEAGWRSGYGNQVLIDHGDGYSTRYAHAELLYVKQGAFVEQNMLLGLIGSTGRSTGPHLHYEVIKNGDKIDPIKVLNLQP
ncbi:MAG: M23 family metallopeptidase [Candidatus Methylopumilus sp.]